MKHLIDRWLAGKRNYTIGTILYKEHGIDDKLKKVFEGPCNDYATGKLLEAMKALAKETEQPKKVEPAITSYEEMPESDDPVLHALREDWLPAYTEMNYKRHELDKYLDDTSGDALIKRAKLAGEIVKLERKCISAWGIRDYYRDHGTMPGATIANEITADKAKAVLTMKNLEHYIRRYKLKLKARPGNVNAANLLKKHQEEYDKLKEIHG